MDSPIYAQWQQWESRVQEWLSNGNDDLDLLETLSFDRVILTILTVKYHLQYTDIDKEMTVAKADKPDDRKATVKLQRTKTLAVEEKNERHREREKLFHDFTGRLLSSEEANSETSAEWQEFNQLYEWHGFTFLQRFEACLRRFVSELIDMTPQYQELIYQPKQIAPASKIDNDVYNKKNEGQVFLTVDIQSANFALLQHIHAIDAQMYPTWSDFLSCFVGPRPLFTQSKLLRMKCLGKLPQYHKLEALWTHFTATIYRKTLCSYFDETDVNARCVALSGDEMVFHLPRDGSVRDEKLTDLIQNIEERLRKDSPIVKFHVQIYRLRTFHWRNRYMCFARLFIGQSDGQFDLKCVPDKDRNYAAAYADFREFSGL